jgi:2,4-dienoyl-CoA reductase-like NADH-dependent reductase (Old Yellow Enzyme family)
MGAFARLLSPGQIGSLQVPDRIVMPPIATNYADPQGFVTDRQIAYYRERARGGAGYLTFEHTGILQQGKAAANMAMLSTDEHVPAFRKLVQAIHAEGGRILIQINHGGRQTTSAFTGQPIVAPSAISCPVRKEMPRALAAKEVRAIVGAFAQAARRVQ